MSAREDILVGLRQLDDSQPGDLTPEELLDAYRAEVLREASCWLTSKYGVTNRAAGDLRRLADEAQGGAR